MKRNRAFAAIAGLILGLIVVPSTAPMQATADSHWETSVPELGDRLVNDDPPGTEPGIRQEDSPWD